jgi:polyisoprenoid-binding protein YceI
MPVTRVVPEAEGLAAGTWTIDPSHADVGFVGRHLGLTKIRGRFVGVSGTVVVADDPAASTVEVSIDMATVSSGDQARDDHLRSSDFFDVEEHPYATFRSTSITIDRSHAELVGDLTIKSITCPVRLEVEYAGHVIDPWRNERAVLSAHGRINREEWGLTWNMFLEAGGLLVSKEILIEVEVELTKQPD